MKYFSDMIGDMQKIYWITTNIYGKVFGWPFLSKFHHAVTTMSLHALGYGNMYVEGWTGEEWFLEKIVKKSNPKIILDVGANVGNYSKLLLEYTDAHIYAFEPNPSSFSKLSELPERVTKINAAVGDKSGKATLNFKHDFDDKASLDSRIRGGHAVEVAVIRLKDFLSEHNIQSVDFLKIDTEGWEKEVLLGLGEVKPKIIQFEFNIYNLTRSYTINDLKESLPDYTFYRLLPNGWTKINPTSYIDNIFIFSNYIAVLDKS
jgi:FkbM family methyltransferase